MSIQEVSRDSRAWRQLRLAEGLRRDGQAAQAFALFESVLSGDTSALSRRQLRWARAHAGAAACAAFEPYSNDSHFLDSAETRLREALELEPSWDHQMEPLTCAGMTEVNYAWAWARLGEVYRFQGNLPGLYFAGDNDALRLTARNGADAYVKGKRCFRRALCQDSNFGWAKAHLGALYLNERRYGSDQTQAQTALDLLKTAAADQDHLNLWTQTHIGCAHFLLGIDKAWASGQLKDDVAGALDAEHLLFALFYTVMGWHAAPDLLKHSLQPGAIELDPTFAILYDLIDILPHVCSDNRGALLECAGKLAQTQVNAAVDAFLPGSAEVRLEYFRAYLLFLEGKGSVTKNVRRILDLTTTIRAGLGKAPLAMSAGNGKLTGVLSMMLVLMKSGVLLLQSHSALAVGESLYKIAQQLNSYNDVLPVLCGDGAWSVQEMQKLYFKGSANGDGSKPGPKGTEWLLSPIWTFGLNQKPEVLNDLLKLSLRAPVLPPRGERHVQKENDHVQA